MSGQVDSTTIAAAMFTGLTCGAVVLSVVAFAYRERGSDSESGAERPKVVEVPQQLPPSQESIVARNNAIMADWVDESPGELSVHGHAASSATEAVGRTAESTSVETPLHNRSSGEKHSYWERSLDTEVDCIKQLIAEGQAEINDENVVVPYHCLRKFDDAKVRASLILSETPQAGVFGGRSVTELRAELEEYIRTCDSERLRAKAIGEVRYQKFEDERDSKHAEAISALGQSNQTSGASTHQYKPYSSVPGAFAAAFGGWVAAALAGGLVTSIASGLLGIGSLDALAGSQQAGPSVALVALKAFSKAPVILCAILAAPQAAMALAYVVASNELIEASDGHEGWHWGLTALWGILTIYSTTMAGQSAARTLELYAVGRHGSDLSFFVWLIVFATWICVPGILGKATLHYQEIRDDKRYGKTTRARK